MFHKTLHRQLIKIFGSEQQIPKGLDPLFQVISDTYLHSDEERNLIERSLDISSKELGELNVQLRSERELIEKEVEKRTQELLAERNKLSLILSGIGDSVIAVNREKKIVLFNKAAENLIGLPISEVLDKPLEDIIKVFDNASEIPANTYCPIRSDDFEGIIYNKKELKLISANGKQIFVNLLAGQIKEGLKVNLGCILTLHDISEERRLDDMKLDFVSMAAHELRTPLTSLRGYTYILIRDYGPKFDEEEKNIVNRISISTQRLVGLVENLLNVARIERGAITVHSQAIDWPQNIKEVISEIINQAKDKNIEINFIEPKEKISAVMADKLRINEVLTNLMANAINYTPAGGKIYVWTAENENEITTYVKDTGEGIPADAIPHLFKKFFRVSGKLEQGSKGTGLGLYISKSIVEMHNGRILVASEGLGKGSTFYFSLPKMVDSKHPTPPTQ